jgi:hypothetical protein
MTADATPDTKPVPSFGSRRPFQAFAPGFRECDEDLSGEAPSNHPLFTPIRHQRSSALSRLIDAFLHGRLGGESTVADPLIPQQSKPSLVVPGKRRVRRSSKSEGGSATRDP